MTGPAEPPPAPDALLVAIGIGANLGDRLATIRSALAGIERIVDDLRVAPIFETEPLSPIAQPDFLNTVALGRSRRTPEELLEELLAVERGLGRIRAERDGPRTIDLDLLFVGDLARNTDRLVLPHPRLRARRFVLAPLAALAPELPIPPDAVCARDLLATLPPAPAVRRLGTLAELAA